MSTRSFKQQKNPGFMLSTKPKARLILLYILIPAKEILSVITIPITKSSKFYLPKSPKVPTMESVLTPSLPMKRNSELTAF